MAALGSKLPFLNAAANDRFPPEFYANRSFLRSRSEVRFGLTAALDDLLKKAK